MARQKTDEAAQETPREVQRYSREKLAQMDRFADRADALIAVLRPERRYTVDEAAAQVDRFMKGSAK